MFLPALIVIILAFSAMLYLRFNKGKIAEKMVHYKLMQLPEEYHVIDDVLFMSNGRSTQIDHIVVSPYAIFVIETKGYKGWILGGENSECWTQIIYKRKSTFYNPIHQNDGHIRFLKFLLKDLGNIPFVPIVVFNNEAELKVNVNTHIVVNRCYLKDAILQSSIFTHNFIPHTARLILICACSQSKNSTQSKEETSLPLFGTG